MVDELHISTVNILGKTVNPKDFQAYKRTSARPKLAALYCPYRTQCPISLILTVAHKALQDPQRLDNNTVANGPAQGLVDVGSGAEGGLQRKNHPNTVKGLGVQTTAESHTTAAVAAAAVAAVAAAAPGKLAQQ